MGHPLCVQDKRLRLEWTGISKELIAQMSDHAVVVLYEDLIEKKDGESRSAQK